MSDKETFQLIKRIQKGQTKPSLFSDSFMDKVPAAQAINWMHENNVIFVIAPPSNVCLEGSYQNGGVPTFFTRFITYGAKAAEALETCQSQNPLLIFREELSSKHGLSNSYGYSAYSALNYSQFIELIEYICEELQKKDILIKRFKVDIDFNDTGKISYSSLDKGKTFLSFIEGYEGEADLYDKSFMFYAWDLMTETLDES